MSLGDGDIVSITGDSAGAIWIGFDGHGLYRLDPETRALRHYEAGPDSSSGISSNKVLCIYEDRLGTLWVGTAGGLNRLDRASGAFSSYRESDGLASEVIYGILEDGDGNLWLSTNEGLSVFDPRTETIKSYGVRDGLQANQFNRGAYHRSRRTGEMFFGGVNGFNAFFPARVMDNPHVPAVVITDFYLLNRLVEISKGSPLDRHITDTKALELSHRDYVFSFEFAALDYAIPEKNQYAYMMEGFDTDWIHSGRRRFASYSNLPAGAYVFRVRGSNNDGVWNEEGASIAITVRPAPWRTWWAYGGYGTVLITVVLGYVRAKTRKHAHELEAQREKLRQQRMINERLRQVDRMKDEFLANTSHELRTPLHGIIGLAESLLDGAAGPPTEPMQTNFRMMISSGRRLCRLVDDILDLSTLKRRTLKLSKSPVDIATVSSVVLKLSEPLTAGKDLTLEPAIGPGLALVLADENRLQQIMHNLVGNAIKFTEAGSVRVSGARIAPA